MPANYSELEKGLWEAADSLRANSSLKPSEYSVPVLGLIFLRYADFKFGQVEKEFAGKKRGRGLKWEPHHYQAKGALFVPEVARFGRLVNLPESADIGKELVGAMEAIAEDNEELKGALPMDYSKIEKPILLELLRVFNRIPIEEIGEDAFGEIYQYFLGNFAQKEGQKGGEFFTPISVVKLIVEIVEPEYGLVFDPACGAGGMFVQSDLFARRRTGRTTNVLGVYGQEKVEGTVRLCKMNLAVHGISGLGNVRVSNTYYEDSHDCLGRFDFVLANPPFNVNGVDKERLEGDERFPWGAPTVDNANYLWIELFYAALNDNGRGGFVMANSASDARGSELEIRRKLIETGAVDVMVAVGSNFFYTVTLPCTLWFLDKGKATGTSKDRVLFVDARHIYSQVDRARREFADEQVEFLANIVRLYRGEPVETVKGSGELLAESFPNGVYRDVAGLCRVATVGEIEGQGWSLNPGRYVGVADRVEDEDFDFAERLEELHEELEVLNAESRELEVRISENVGQLLGF